MHDVCVILIGPGKTSLTAQKLKSILLMDSIDHVQPKTWPFIMSYTCDGKSLKALSSGKYR